MSIKVMSLVWDKFPLGGSDKLVMLAMADWCNDEGGSLHPSHQAVADKCCMSRSQAQRIVRALEAEGWLVVVGNQYGGAPGATKQYRLNVERLRNCDGYQDATGSAHATGSVDATGSMDAQDGSHGCYGTGSMGATQTTIEPPISTSKPAAKKSSQRGPVGIDSFLKSCSESGQKPIPEDDKVFALADRVGIPDEYLWLAWREFVDRSRENGKRYTDWRAAFRNCVRGNWYKLWYLQAEGTMALTTQGLLAQKLHREAA